eukprot:Skav221051  [mRNA]  locus=scaffold1448:332951:341972:+ [translate_table: standard]
MAATKMKVKFVVLLDDAADLKGDTIGVCGDAEKLGLRKYSEDLEGTDRWDPQHALLCKRDSERPNFSFVSDAVELPIDRARNFTFNFVRVRHDCVAELEASCGPRIINWEEEMKAKNFKEPLIKSVKWDDEESYLGTGVEDPAFLANPKCWVCDMEPGTVRVEMRNCTCSNLVCQGCFKDAHDRPCPRCRDE